MRGRNAVWAARWAVMGMTALLWTEESLAQLRTKNNEKKIAPKVKTMQGMQPKDTLADVQDDEQSFDVAVLLHAEALEAELDGYIDRSIALLRRAVTVRVDDREIAYDLARISYETNRRTLRQDSDVFLSLPAESVREYLLQTYIWLEEGDVAAAKSTLTDALRAHPNSQEALRLGESLGVQAPILQPSEGPSVFARLQLSTAYDTNIKIIPQTLYAEEPEEDRQGVRTQADALVMWNRQSKRSLFNIGGVFSAGVYPMVEATNLRPYNQGLASLFSTYRILKERSVWSVGVDGNLVVFQRNLDETFMRTGGATVAWSTRHSSKPNWGLMARGAYRDFVHSNDEGGLSDRDGVQANVGPTLSWANKQWSVGGQILGNYENAEGDAQKVYGARANMAGLWRRGALGVGFGVNYEYRNFFESSDARQDHRVAPNLNLRLNVVGPLAVVGSYIYTQNFSSAQGDGTEFETDDAAGENYAYTRHVGQLGLEARW